MVMDKEKKLEDKKIRQLRFLVDMTVSILYQQQSLSLEEAVRLIEGVRRTAVRLFPGKEQAFDLIYAPRFRRILSERFPVC